MKTNELSIRALEVTELQFRLASAVRMATTLKEQPLQLPTEWVHGKHRIFYAELALTMDEADLAALLLQKNSTYMMAVEIRKAIVDNFKDPKNHSHNEIKSAYQISRLIRNAFTHKPLDPIWSIDNDCKNKVFEIDGVIRLDTSSLNEQIFDWQHYGGPLALLKLSQYVRQAVLEQPISKNRQATPQIKKVYQQGNLIFQETTKMP